MHLKGRFESNTESTKFELRNRLEQIKTREDATFDSYFGEVSQIISQLGAIGALPLDSDLVHIVMRAIPNNYDHFLRHYAESAYRHFPIPNHLCCLFKGVGGYKFWIGKTIWCIY